MEDLELNSKTLISKRDFFNIYLLNEIRKLQYSNKYRNEKKTIAEWFECLKNFINKGESK